MSVPEVLEVNDKRHSALVPVVEEPQPQGIMAVVTQLASNPNVDIDKIRQLLEMQERWEVNRDKSALRHAVAEFKKNPPKIVKDRIAKVRMKDDKGEFTYSYADLEAVSGAIEAELATYDVIHSFITDDTATNGDIRVTCVLRYGLYEEQGASLKAQPDTSGTKNPIQAKGSTVSYLEKYTLLGTLGMAAGMPDPDGNPIKAPLPKIDLDEAWSDRCKLIAEAETLKAATEFYNEAYQVINGMKKAKPEDAQSALTSINAALDAAKRRFKK